MEDDTSSPSPSLPPLLLPPLLSERVADSQEEAIGDVPLHSDTTNHESLIVSTEPTMETRYPRSVSVGVDDWTLEKRQVPEDTIFSRWSHRRSSLPCSPLDDAPVEICVVTSNDAKYVERDSRLSEPLSVNALNVHPTIVMASRRKGMDQSSDSSSTSTAEILQRVDSALSLESDEPSLIGVSGYGTLGTVIQSDSISPVPVVRVGGSESTCLIRSDSPLVVHRSHSHPRLYPELHAPPHIHHTHGHRKDGDQLHGFELVLASVACCGVVFGDIGTSPLYVFQSVFPDEDSYVSEAIILGTCSLIFWSLTMVVMFKYLLWMMRASYKGEGGVFSLLALLLEEGRVKGVSKWIVLNAALFGAALLFGDGIITPSISVLSAVEGLAYAEPNLQDYTIWITSAILLVLFLFQFKGTGGLGKVFGPIMIIWFVCLGCLGAVSIRLYPQIFKAISPHYIVVLFREEGSRTLVVLGATILCITGSEALYADMGHFGAKPIRCAWLFLIYPSLILNYFGQGANLIQTLRQDPDSFFRITNHSFWAIVPSDPGIYFPMVALSTLATVIASQALIAGAFTLTKFAVHLGYLPRFRIIHTSEADGGQIYVPVVNWILAILCITLVLVYKSSERLSNAYGMAVTGNMCIDSNLLIVLTQLAWNWKWYQSLLLWIVIQAFDFTYLVAVLLKFPKGGWLPASLALIIMCFMKIWHSKSDRILMWMAVRQQKCPSCLRCLCPISPSTTQVAAEDSVNVSGSFIRIPVTFKPDLDIFLDVEGDDEDTVSPSTPLLTHSSTLNRRASVGV